MLGALAIAWLAMSDGAAGDNQPWAIELPALWSDVTAERAAADPDLARGVALPAGAQQELRVFTGPDGASMLVHLVMVPGDPKDRGQAIVNWEAGARAGLEGQPGTRTVAYHQRRDGEAYVADLVAERNGQRLYVRRVAGLDPRSNLVGLTATCLGRESTCLPVLRTARLTTRLIPATMPAAASSASTSHGGRFLLVLVAAVVGAGILFGVVLALTRRPRRRRA